LTFLGIGIAIAAGARVLVPQMRTLAELVDRELKEGRRRTLRRDPALKLFDSAPELLCPFASLGELSRERDHYLTLYSEAYRKWSDHPTKTHATSLERAGAAGEEVDDVAYSVGDWANYATVRGVYNTALFAVFFGVILAAIGLTIFALKVPDVPSTAPTPATVQLQGAKLHGSAVFKGQILHGADLQKTDLSAANLTNTDLSNTNLNHAQLNKADLTHANLEGASGLTPATVKGAIWSVTTCPDGRVSDEVGKSCASHLAPRTASSAGQ
jgi:pentapeptide repeat protein